MFSRTVVDHPTSSTPVSVTVGDLNADDKLDLIVGYAAGSSVSLLLGHGDGTFAPKIDYRTGLTPRSVIAADLDGDTRLDLAVGNYSGNTVSVLLNHCLP